MELIEKYRAIVLLNFNSSTRPKNKRRELKDGLFFR